jgi:hypothetical protein
MVRPGFSGGSRVWTDDSHVDRTCTDSGRASRATDVWDVGNAREHEVHLWWWVGMVGGYGSASCEGFGVAYEFEVISTDLCC